MNKKENQKIEEKFKKEETPFDDVIKDCILYIDELQQIIRDSNSILFITKGRIERVKQLKQTYEKQAKRYINKK